MNKLDLKRGEKLHECTEIIKRAGENMMKSFYAAGVALKTVKDEELWKESYESFESYFAELGFEKSRVYRAIQTVEKFELDTVANMQLGKLYAVLPHVTDANKSEMVSMAQSLSMSDLYHQLKKNGEPEAKEPPKIHPCLECGGMKGIRFSDLCRCDLSKKQVIYIQTLIDKAKDDDYEI